MASYSALPYIVSLSAVLSVPWRPHCGLQLRLRSSGSQLLCRQLVLAAQLPQVPRPTTQPQEGSKSSKARGVRILARRVAQDRMATATGEMFGDLCSAGGATASTSATTSSSEGEPSEQATSFAPAWHESDDEDDYVPP
eukprot:240206-Pyramimonas_sp.AAC.1